jgi:hypothetical protein
MKVLPGTVTLVESGCKPHHSIPIEKGTPPPDAALVNKGIESLIVTWQLSR